MTFRVFFFFFNSIKELNWYIKVSPALAMWLATFSKSLHHLSVPINALNGLSSPIFSPFVRISSDQSDSNHLKETHARWKQKDDDTMQVTHKWQQHNSMEHNLYSRKNMVYSAGDEHIKIRKRWNISTRRGGEEREDILYMEPPLLFYYDKLLISQTQSSG